jgi:hypothetical protein
VEKSVGFYDGPFTHVIKWGSQTSQSYAVGFYVGTFDVYPTNELTRPKTT